MAVTESTKIKALREAQNLVQAYGYNGFSFQHIADRLGIKKPSLYDHFKSKEELGLELVQRYHDLFIAWTETIDVFEPADRIGAYFELFFKYSSESTCKLCPLTAMIGESNSLPKNIRKKMAMLYDYQVEWMKKNIEQGQKQKQFRKSTMDSEDLAKTVLAIGLGSQLIGRVSDDPKQIHKLKAQALAILT